MPFGSFGPCLSTSCNVSGHVCSFSSEVVPRSPNSTPVASLGVGNSTLCHRHHPSSHFSSFHFSPGFCSRNRTCSSRRKTSQPLTHSKSRFPPSHLPEFSTSTSEAVCGRGAAGGFIDDLDGFVQLFGNRKIVSDRFEVEIPDSLKSKKAYVFPGLTIDMAEMI